MQLTTYVLDGHEIDIRPAPMERDWMSDSTERFAYRCLPLNIANSFGWQIHTRWGFEAEWKGGAKAESVVVTPDEGNVAPAVGHFGGGALTFHVPCLFRTEPGFDLMAQGPINAPKDAIAPLTGIIETDWAPYTFTMNWLFTRVGQKVRFERDEPFCHLFPVKRGEVERFEPKYRKLSENPELEREMETWKESRGALIESLKEPGATARESWQRLLLPRARPKGPTRTACRTQDTAKGETLQAVKTAQILASGACEFLHLPLRGVEERKAKGGPC